MTAWSGVQCWVKGCTTAVEKVGDQCDERWEKAGCGPRPSERCQSDGCSTYPLEGRNGLCYTCSHVWHKANNRGFWTGAVMGGVVGALVMACIYGI
jgi:hypothetical protein